MIKVLLVKNVPGVGKEGDIKNVKEGYALNFLLPKGFGVKLTPAEEEKLKNKQKKAEKKRLLVVEKKHEYADLLRGKVLNFKLKTHDNGKVYGGIGEKDIISEIKKKFKIDLERKHVDMGPGGHIKKIGTSEIFIKFGGGYSAKMVVEVSAG